ncbi:NUDIX hydrolase [Paenibacillus oryzisoli]|uniref:DNA mismatch repair protein MutT n=1 Tax=Paenibacillus oryzisoli TaxID=1850517 RepID=A0A198AGD5_9BACL|nr:NUDIX hydrolase [Paenibacillus oryzisoli]OAS20292.1 DNA mismatch repair protein MutT [Paenibacillus oryzisoli]
MEYYKQIRQFVGNRPIILPGAVVILVNEREQILLQQRLNETWGLPGGLMDLGESLEDTARREFFEETGLTVGDLTLVGVFSGAQYHYTLSNGDEFYAVTTTYMAREATGELVMETAETRDLQYFDWHDLPETLGQVYRDSITAYLQNVSKR